MMRVVSCTCALKNPFEGLTKKLTIMPCLLAIDLQGGVPSTHPPMSRGIAAVVGRSAGSGRARMFAGSRKGAQWRPLLSQS